MRHCSPFLDPDLPADLARRLERLRPSHRDPEAFFVERSAIAAELRRLARAASDRVRGPVRAREMAGS